MKQRLAPLVVLVVGACAGGAPKTLPPPPRDDGFFTIVTPARWAFHPAAPKATLATLVLPDGGCVFTSAGGQRWTTAPLGERSSAPAAPCSGKSAAATFTAPEDLVAVARTKRGSFAFAGATGTLYEADQPLGAFTRTTPPKKPFARVRALPPCDASVGPDGCGARFLGVTTDGGIERWTEAGGFSSVSAGEARVTDVAADEKGRAVALAMPEALYASEDGGATWKKSDAPTIGAQRVGRTKEGALAAQGPFESLVLGAAPNAGWTRSRAAALSGASPPALDVGHAPSAAAVLDLRAAIDGERYVELIAPTTPKAAFLLARGKLDGALDIAPLPLSSGCTSARVALRGKAVAVACTRKHTEGSLEVVVRRSADFGATFGDPATLRANGASVEGLAISSDGAVLVSGVCRSGEDECKSHAPVLVRGDATHPVAITSSADQLVGDGSLLAFSFDGRSAYFIGKRGKDERLSLFVSHDGGETFSPRSLSISEVHEPAQRSDDDDDEPKDRGETELDLDDHTSFLTAAEDGNLSVGLRGEGLVLATLDDDGRLLATNAAPEGAAALGGFGRRAVALAPSDAHGLALFESGDGGATWDETSAPMSLDGLAQEAIACGAAGCLLGETLTRVGWGGSSEERDKPADDAEPPHSAKPLTPIVCELARAKPWNRIEHVYGHDAGLGLLPDAREAMRGKTAWSVFTFDAERGAATAIAAFLPESGDGDVRVTSRPLLSASSGHLAYSLDHLWQVEGYFVARAPIALDAKGGVVVGAPLKNIEVAWENFEDGTSGHARIADAGVVERGDVVPRLSSFELASALGSVTLKSAFLEPHHRGAADDRVHLLRSAGGQEIVRLPRWPAKGIGDALDISEDVALVDGAPFGVGLLQETRPEGGFWSALLMARLDPKSKDRFDGSRAVVTAVAAPRGDNTALVHSGWTYLGTNTVGLATTISDRVSGKSWAYFDPFRVDGSTEPAVAIPTLRDAGDRPRPCTKNDRETTPRVSGQTWLGRTVFLPGTARAVLVSEPREPSAKATGLAGDASKSPVATLALISANAVLYGTAASPCVAAYEAQSFEGPGQASLLVAGDLAHAWLFRKAADRAGDKSASRHPAIEWRAASCRYDASAKLTEEQTKRLEFTR